MTSRILEKESVNLQRAGDVHREGCPLNRAEKNRDQCVLPGAKLLQSRLSVSNLCWLTDPQ